MPLLQYLYGLSHAMHSNMFVTLPLPTGPPDLAQQTIIITGANTGLGLESSHHLLRLGLGKLVMGVRNLDKGEAARAELLKSTQRAPECIEVWRVDMEDYDSVKAFAQRATTTLPRLDAVLANAGLLAGKFTYCVNGPHKTEKTVAVNVVSTFLLFFLLLPKLRQSPSGGRFSIPNSAMHWMAPNKDLAADGRILARLNDASRNPDMSDRYSLSKLLVVYVVRELAARMAAASRDKPAVTVNTPNPSYCKSGLLRESSAPAPPDFLARTTEMGSRALVHGLLAGPESSGHFLTNCHAQAPALMVTSKSGAKIQKAFFEELVRELGSITSGVTASL